MNYKKLFFSIALCMIFFLGTYSSIAQKTKPVIIGYVGGFRGNIIEPSSIDAKRLSHINYAFVDINDNRAWLHNGKTDTINFRRLNELKSINPDLKIIISIGGWTWSKNFSDAVLTDTSTQNFAQSAVDIVSRYDL